MKMKGIALATFGMLLAAFAASAEARPVASQEIPGYRLVLKAANDQNSAADNQHLNDYITGDVWKRQLEGFGRPTIKCPCCVLLPPTNESLRDNKFEMSLLRTWEQGS